VEFLDDGTLASSSNDGSTKFWDISTGTPKTDVPGKTFTFSKAAAGTAPGTEQRAGRYIITAEGDLLLVHHADGGEASDAKKVPVAFFRAPSPVRTVACAGEHIGIGCESGAVIHLRASWLVES
jgi:WD40 repeat protein